MLIIIIMTLIWAFLMFRAGVAEYKYYQAVKNLEPEIWRKLGSPKNLKVPVVFVSSKGVKLLNSISNNRVCDLARKHRQAGIHFLMYVIMVLVASIMYFKIA
jgi:hypothetical protein